MRSTNQNTILRQSAHLVTTGYCCTLVLNCDMAQALYRDNFNQWFKTVKREADDNGHNLMCTLVSEYSGTILTQTRDTKTLITQNPVNTN